MAKRVSSSAGLGTPRVSIVMAALNAEAFIGEAVESVLSQTMTDWELLIVNDGSSDRTGELAASFAKSDPRIQVLAHPGGANRGLSPSRNLALEQAQGLLVAILDSDDVWSSAKLADQVAIMDAHPEVGMVCGAVEYWSSWSGGQDEVRRTGFVSNAVVPPPYMAIHTYPLGKWHAPTPSDVMIRRSLIAECGGFEDQFIGPYGMYEDQALFGKIYLAASVFLSDKQWLRYRQHAASIVQQETRSGRYRTIRTFYLDWFADYLRVSGRDGNLALCEALQNARLVQGSTSLRLLERLRRKIAAVVER